MITASERILTNQLLIDELDLWFELDSKSIEDDEAKKFYQKLSSLIDDDLDAAIKWLESDEAKEIFFGQVEAQKEIFDALETEWDSILNQSYDSVDELLDEIYKTGKEKGYENIRETLRYTDADRQAIRIAKDYNFHLIRKLDNDLRGTVKNKILKGIISGENPYNLARDLVDAGVQQLDGSTFTPRQRATMIAKTETSRMQNTGMLQSYINEGYREVKILTAEDSNVCTTCLEYAYRFNKDEPRVFSPELLEREKVHNIIKLIKGGKFPPFHPNCRCTYLTVWGSKTEPPKNPYVVDLTPSLKSPYTSNGKYKGGEIPFNMSEDDLRLNLKGIVDEKDMDHVVGMIEKFLDDVKNDAFEWSTGSGNSGYIQKELFPSWSAQGVDLHPDLMSEGLDEGLITLIHNHARFHAILPSPEDTESYAVYKVKYGLLINDFGICVIKNKHPDTNDVNSIDITKKTESIKENIEEKFQLVHPEFVKFLNKDDDKYYAELNKYIRKNSKYFEKMYQDGLGEWFSVKLIKNNFNN